MGYPKRVGGVRFIEVSGRPEPILPALRLRPSGDVEQFRQVVREAIAGSSAATGEASREC